MQKKKNRTQQKREYIDNIYNQCISGEPGLIRKNDKLVKKLQQVMSDHDSINLFEEIEVKISLSITGQELLLLFEALRLKEMEIVAKYYIKNTKSKNQGIKDWDVVSEIFGLKGLGARAQKYPKEALFEYKARVEYGVKPNESAEYINKKYNFPNQEACNKWIHDEIKRNEDQGVSIYSRLKKPSKEPI